MSVFISADNDSELFLPDAFLQLEATLQGIRAVTPDACIENLKPKAGTLHFQYDGDKLKSIYYRTVDEEQAS